MIDSIKRQVSRLQYDVELLITDDGSREDVLSFLNHRELEDYFADWKYFWQPDMDFLAGQARNLALRNAVGDIILLLDGDMIPDRNLIDQHLQYHRKNPSSIVSGGRKLLYYHDIKNLEYVDYNKFWSLVVTNEEEEEYRQKWYKSSLPWKALFSSNLSFPNKKGLLFNERLIGWGIEDWEFCFQATRKGLEPVFKPGFTTFHVDKDDAVFNVFRLNSSDGMAKFARNVLIFMDENPAIDLSSCAVALKNYRIYDDRLEWSESIVTPSVNEAIVKMRQWLDKKKIY